MNFTNTLAVVTSVASGIGRAIADSFSRTDRRGVRGLPGGPRTRFRAGISRTSWIRSRVDRGAPTRAAFNSTTNLFPLERRNFSLQHP
jgi:NAD(P)-dependent dehydrogenase (short-subunit alcohol dehydrogenase family)